MSEVEAKFKKAAYLIRNGPPNPNATNDSKLKYYSYYKQATEGDVKGSQGEVKEVARGMKGRVEHPMFFQIEARAKWDAWNALKGTSKEEAMQKYVDLLAADDPNWESHPVLADYKLE